MTRIPKQESFEGVRMSYAESVWDFDFNIFDLNFNHIYPARCYSLDTPPHYISLPRLFYLTLCMLKFTAANIPTLLCLWPVVVPIVTPAAE